MKLINGFEPQFIVRTANSGTWSRSLVDTGASLSFVDTGYANTHLKSLVQTADNPLSVRLGDSSKTPVNKYIESIIRYKNREVTVTQWLMSLPPAIDNILGLDYMRLMNIMIDPANRRIILLDENPADDTGATAAILDSSDSSFLVPDSYLAFASDCSVKTVRSKVFTVEKSTVHSDSVITSTNKFNKLLDQFNQGLLNFDRTNALLDVDLHPQTAAGCAAASAGAHTQSPKGGGDNIKPTLKRRFDKYTHASNFNVDSESSKDFKDRLNTMSDKPETSWLINCMFTADNKVDTVNFNGSDFNLGGENGMDSSPEASNEAINSFVDWQDAFNKSVGYNPSCHLTNPEGIPPPLYKGCPKDINKTDPTQLEWVEKLTTGKLGKFTCTDPVDHFNPLKSDEPLHIRLKPGATMPSMHRYRTPDHLLPEFKRYIDEMVQKGWLKPSNSEYAAPILIIKKPGTYEDGTSKGYRFVSDFRKLNSVVRPLQHHIPDLVEMWEQLKTAKYISVCDARHGFWNAPVSVASQKYISVQTPWSTYSYTCVPMGLINSSAYFQRWLQRKLRKHGILYEPTVVSFTPDSAIDGSIDLNSKSGYKEGLEGDPNFKSVRTQRTAKEKTKWGFTGFVCIYQDDLCIFSNNIKEHREHLLILFRVLSAERIPLNVKKCHFFCKFVRYLGCICGDGHLFLDPQKCDAIHKMVIAKDITSIRSFLGLTGFYRRWVKNYAEMSRHLSALTKKGVDIKSTWGPIHDKAITDLKAAITSYPVLRQPMADRPWVIATDASNYQIGASIGQMVDGKMTVTAYCSRALRGPELNYPIQHKEALACIYALEKFNHYLLGCPHFTIRMWTDHQSLQFMHTQKDLAGRMARWAMKLAEYNATVKYLRGDKNVVADALSRLISATPDEFNTASTLMHLYPEILLAMARLMPKSGTAAYTTQDEAGNLSVNDSFLMAVSTDFAHLDLVEPDIITDPSCTSIERILFSNCLALSTSNNSTLVFDENTYINCKQFGVIYRALHPKHKSGLSVSDLKNVNHRLPLFFIEHGLLRYMSPMEGEVIAVPSGGDKTEINSFRIRIIKELHSSNYAGHRGISRTHLSIRRRYYWPKMINDIKTFIKGCTCQFDKTSRQLKQGSLQPLINPYTPGTHYSMDFKTDLPRSGPEETCFDQILVIVDRFSKRVWLIPTRARASSRAIAEHFLQTIVSKRGLPLSITSDRDPRFTANFWQSLWKLTGTTLAMSTARHQNTDGQSEIAIRIMEEILRGVLNYKQDNWVARLPMIEFALNNAVSTAHGLTPFLCETGRNPITPADYSQIKLAVLPATKPTSRAHQFLADINSAHAQARDALMLARDRMSRFADARRRKEDQIKVGGQVCLKLEGIDFKIFKTRPSKKLGLVWYGPFEVISKCSPVAFKLVLPASHSRLHDVFHVDRLKPYFSTLDLTGKALKLPALQNDEYEIEAILDERVVRRKREFLVHWKGYSELYDNTWEPEGSFINARDIMKKWRKSHKPLATS